MKRLASILATIIMLAALIVPTGVTAFAADDDPEKQADKFPVSENEIIKFDFNDDGYDPELEGWCVLGGKWVVEDGSLKQTRNFTGWNEKQLNFTQKTFGDFTAKMRFKVKEVDGASQCWFAFAFRRKQYNHQHEESGYIVTTEGFKSIPQGKSLMVNWTKQLSYEEYAEAVDINDWVDLVVVAKGNVFTFYYNDAIESGEYTFRINDPDWAEPGFIGLAAGNALIEVDYLYLYTGDKQEGIVKENANEAAAAVDRTIKDLEGQGKDNASLVIMIISAVALAAGVTTLFIGGKKA
ncbi:MAG: DUF1080 domain-containing protein [Clostridia bacterium]|nr:DUF1080 domain-containing protein [Clostridia bacterium]